MPFGNALKMQHPPRQKQRLENGIANETKMFLPSKAPHRNRTGSEGYDVPTPHQASATSWDWLSIDTALNIAFSVNECLQLCWVNLPSRSNATYGKISSLQFTRTNALVYILDSAS
jgi:hypothetical protein